jgi:putative oxidoreductase
MQKYLTTLGRILLAQIFFISIVITVAQIMNHPQGYQAYYAHISNSQNGYGLPGIFAPLTIFIQSVFGFGLLLGYKTKTCAYTLAAYAIFVAIFMKLQEMNGLILAMQYLAIAGGLLLLAVNDKTALSLDNLKKSV